MYKHFRANVTADSRNAAIGADNQSKTAMEARGVSKMSGLIAIFALCAALLMSCEDKDENSSKSIADLERMIADYVKMCCTEHADMHYNHAMLVNSNVISAAWDARLYHWACITNYIISVKGANFAINATGEMIQPDGGEVLDGSLTSIRITELRRGEKIDPVALRISITGLSYFDYNRAIMRYTFSFSDEIIWE